MTSARRADGEPAPERRRDGCWTRGSTRLGRRPSCAAERRTAGGRLDILTMGITFTVYSDGTGIDRAWPFDVIPRVIEASEWRGVEAGLVQRLRALNRFIDDLYNDQQDRRATACSRPTCWTTRSNFRPECRGRPPGATACGRTSAAAISSATPTARSTCSRTTCASRPASATCWRTALISKRAFADLFARQSILPVDAYTDELNKLLVSLAPDGVAPPDGRRAHAGHLQLGVLRALVPRPADGRRARRGPRPRRRRRRLRLHAHDRRPASRST